jgi:hypothetical protein
MLVSQFIDGDGSIRVAMREQGGLARVVAGHASVYDLALRAADSGAGFASVLLSCGFAGEVDLAELYGQGRLVLPIRHPDPAHMYLTGTGLTHLGSAATRGVMHSRAGSAADLTDSMKMFDMGIEGGKPQAGRVGVQPEWFYKGDGSQAVAPGGDLLRPSFALDGGEEPEIAGIYVVSSAGEPLRIGFCLANEFSDHVMERINYLYLAHSKLRQASFGPEISIGPPPAEVSGMSRILRDGERLWEKPFMSGEKNMSHSFANLEYHHFKYSQFRRAGDLHVHMFGTATLSFADGVQTLPGDVFEIESDRLGLPLRNRLLAAETTDPVVVRQL